MSNEILETPLQKEVSDYIAAHIRPFDFHGTIDTRTSFYVKDKCYIELKITSLFGGTPSLLFDGIIESIDELKVILKTTNITFKVL